MIYLRPMLEKEYIPYLERSIIEYAEDKIKAGNWHPSEALERSRQEFQKLLKKVGYNNNAIGNLWKWYDYSERKGVASY